MSSPQRPAPPDPIADPALPEIDSSLFELDGPFYKDLSRSASAQRAAYHRALAARFLASHSGTPLAEQTPMAVQPAGIGVHVANFENFGTSPDWTPEYGTQEAGQEGWIMHSQGDTSSRMTFNYTLNDGSSPYTEVLARLRGAPDNGKNSYVTLIEQLCADNPGTYFCDEIDIVEYYGQTSDQRSEFTVHQNGQRNYTYYMVWPTGANDPGHNQTGYNMYLEPGNFMDYSLYDANGNNLGGWSLYASDGAYIPTRPMNLYVGIWDIGLALGTCVDIPPGSFPGDSWMALSQVWIWTSS
jgi:hypothetical protein